MMCGVALALLRRFDYSRLAASALWALIAVAPSCTLGDAPPNCVPGASAPCVGENGCAGHQTCAPDGYRYQQCECGTGQTVPPFTIDAGADGALPNMLGAPCITDDDCGTRLFCLATGSSTIFDEGPANGYCTADCAKDASICTNLDAASTCRTFDDKGTPGSTSDDIAYCTRGCTTGTPSGIEKCFHRPDVACIALGALTTNGSCIPACRNDADCAPRFCDLASGLCADGARKGTEIGSACSASSADTCSGLCRVSGSFGMCSGFCSNGYAGCGDDTSSPLEHFCVFPQTSGGGWNGGDFGFCGKLCDCNDDCKRSDAVCVALPAAQASATGRKGACRAAIAGGDPITGIACAP
jgi:hypothetical protein